MKHCLLAALICSCPLVASAQEGKDALDAAKSLYLSAAYQEALIALDTVKTADEADEAAKYRALCLIGLNRPQDAEQTIEHLIERRPLFTLDALDSPKLRALFADARARVLPAAATNLYQAAKASFDRGELTAAADQFATVVTLLGQPEVASQPSVADLKVLATGFAKLVDQQLALQRQVAAAAVKPAAPAPQAGDASSTRETLRPTEAARAPESPRTSDPPPIASNGRDPAIGSAIADERIYSEQDADVVPPVPISQSIPAWVPPMMSVQSMTFAGTLDIVVDENGAVALVTITRPTIATYDQRLVAAAKNWRYRPASREGRPVKYRKTIHITLRPHANMPGQNPSGN